MDNICISSLEKSLFIFTYLANEPSSSLNLSSTNKQVKLDHNNVHVCEYEAQNLHIDMYTCIKKHLYRLELIWLYKFVNKFIRYQIIVYNLLIVYL